MTDRPACLVKQTIMQALESMMERVYSGQNLRNQLEFAEYRGSFLKMKGWIRS